MRQDPSPLGGGVSLPYGKTIKYYLNGENRPRIFWKGFGPGATFHPGGVRGRGGGTGETAGRGRAPVARNGPSNPLNGGLIDGWMRRGEGGYSFFSPPPED